MQVNISEAQSSLSRYIEMIESKQEKQIIIARRGKPVVKIVALNDKPIENRIGIAAGKFKAPDDLDKYNDEIAEMFGVDE